MGTALRVVLDQLAQVVDADQAAASVAITAGLIATSPSGCQVDAIVAAESSAAPAGVVETKKLALRRRELAAAWKRGIVRGVGGGLIHAPTLMAPLARHDRVNNNDQVAVTVWDLRAWEAPEQLPKGFVSWNRVMLTRAAKYADAVIVPTHSFVERLQSLADLSDRIRVIAGAPPQVFFAGDDAARRRDAMMLPERYVVVSGDDSTLHRGFAAAAAAGVHAVVMDVAEGAEPRLADIASSAGLSERAAHMRGALAVADRAALLAGAEAFVATGQGTAWPWRMVEAIALRKPIVAVRTPVYSDVIADGGLLVEDSDLADAVVSALDEQRSRLSVLAGDRSRGFSWTSAAERVWALHAEL